MKLRDMMFLVIGGLLVISGMVLNTLISGDVEAQGGLEIVRFKYVFCEGLYIVNDEYKLRGAFQLSSDKSNAILHIFGDDGETPVAYLGRNTEENNEMMFRLTSKSKTDKRMAFMGIDRNGGRFDSKNKMGENVVRIVVGDSGGGLVDTRDKFGYRK